MTHTDLIERLEEARSQEIVLRLKKRMEEVHNADDRYEMPGWYHELAEAAWNEVVAALKARNME